jgi:hypothetical protein
MIRNSFVLFHDFTHPGNAKGDPDYGVVKAIEDTLSKDFKFYGIFGACALYHFEGVQA